MFIRNALFALFAVGLSACVVPSGQDASPPTVQTLTPSLEEYKSLGYKELTYKANGKTYTLMVLRKAKGNFGMDKVHIHVSKGTPFTATLADDVEVQNSVRDAYRALKVCPANLHPGIVKFAYGPIMVNGVPTWNVFLRCTKKLQSNI